MARRKASERAFGKALTLWEPPEGAGEAKVCVASTFTFKADFFETECLGRFLGMDAHPAESDAVSYMVEREEKLASARVVVLADRRHAQEKESLRWDVLGVLARGGLIQHSKISLLAWTNHVRVIVGSGNLTEPGYRRNLEVFGVLDISREDGGDRTTVLRVVDFLGELVDASVGTDVADAPKARAKEALRSVRTLVEGWPDNKPDNPVLLLGGPGRSILAQVGDNWPSNSPARSAYVVSPFFDGDGKEAADALLGVLSKNRPREVFFDVRTEDGADGRTRVFAPLPMVRRTAEKADVTVRPVPQVQASENRDLHAKMIYLGNDRWSLLLMGSSNFTSAGLGTNPNRANFEANLLYRVRSTDEDRRVLDNIWPETGEALDIDSGLLVWEPKSEDDEEGGSAMLPLPGAFEEASFVPGPPASLAITLRAPLPRAWSIQAPDGRLLLSSSRGTGPGAHIVKWEGPDVPFLLDVAWTHESGDAVAAWPVNVSNPAMLPPPEALRSLTLEELLQVLSSTRPMPQAVAEVLAKRAARKEGGNAELDPLKRHESQTYLLRRTKRLSAALDRLRERLERPVSSREAFEWRLFGPVGPLALAEGYVREASVAGEAKFCIAEIALALHRVVPDKVAVDGLPRSVVAESLKKAVQKLAEHADKIDPVPELDGYAQAAFAEAGQ